MVLLWRRLVLVLLIETRIITKTTGEVLCAASRLHRSADVECARNWRPQSPGISTLTTLGRLAKYLKSGLFLFAKIIVVLSYLGIRDEVFLEKVCNGSVLLGLFYTLSLLMRKKQPREKVA